MPLNFEQISTDLYQKVKVRFPSLQIGNSEGKVTSEPNLARFFDFDFENAGQSLGRVSIALTEKDGMMVLHSADIVSEQADDVKNSWFDFLKELRQFAKKRLLNFDIRDISKSNLDKRDFQYIAQNSIGEPKMSESKLFGTSKTSYQDLGEVRLIVKHSQPVNLNAVNGRTQHIQGIYLENSQGERFRYPYKHLSGARALASHVAEGGTPYDSIGQHVIGLSEELSKLRQYKNYVFRNPFMIETMGDLTEKANYRIAEIKKQLEGLQRPAYYKQFKESFNVTELKEVPEEVINDWTEKLTIKKFKEDLATVFPYLYKLSETVVEEQDVQELSYEDFVEEDNSEEIEFTKEDSYWSSFEEELDAVRPEHEQSVGEGFSSDVEHGLHGLAQSEDYDELYDLLTSNSPLGKAVQDMYDDVARENRLHPDDDNDEILDRLMDRIADDYGEGDFDAPEADFDKVAAVPKEGNEFAAKVQKLKAMGAKPGTKFKTSDGEEHTLKDAIQQAGLQLEDFYDLDEIIMGEEEEVKEYVKSHFDYTTNQFPRGETSVITSVSKKFGDEAVGLAQEAIQELQTNLDPEIARIKRLSGM